MRVWLETVDHHPGPERAFFGLITFSFPSSAWFFERDRCGLRNCWVVIQRGSILESSAIFFRRKPGTVWQMHQVFGQFSFLSEAEVFFAFGRSILLRLHYQHTQVAAVYCERDAVPTAQPNFNSPFSCFPIILFYDAAWICEAKADRHRIKKINGSRAHQWNSAPTINPKLRNLDTSFARGVKESPWRHGHWSKKPWPHSYSNPTQEI